ncbi:MAG: Type II adenine specific DNA methyltransferase [Candidatus Wolfebacteria bacterium GW2011_GWC1_37_10]|uniref:LexA repressor n=1 Tax=Candidatus Wolfebacteria bacterium GW2011_GWC1_37_10 TaxID=1619010 RepID=A0A0G0IZQ8_9BACT|nr:MAG: Type II adenine specific DNA methyltransferase [Candidatus Wolfebacteria bacterium GW2011_GWC1_37_10]
MLTKRQKQILDFITYYNKRYGVSPSLEEIKRHFRLKSVSGIHQHIETLKKKDYLNKAENQPRSIEVLRREEMIKIPLLGIIAAGQPIEAIENPSETITVSKNEIGKFGNYYALRVQGNSMIDDGIFDGDIVVIRKQETADDGQTVVAIIDDNEATLKKIYREKSRIKLQPANQEMLPIYRKEVEVRGVVVKIVRNLENGTKDKTLAYKKKIFLDRIKGSNPKSQNKYKRVVLSPIRYAGGKSLAVGHVVELLPDNVKRVVSPFFGGGSIEIAMSKELDLEVIGYDIFDILCNYWKFQIEKPKLLYEKLKELRPNKTTFEKIRLILNDVWKKKVKLDPLTLAVYYVYNFNLSYGPGFMGWSSEIYLDDKRYKRMIENIKNFNPKNLKVECVDFRNVIKNHQNDFLYCDPPYYIGKDSKMFRGIYPMRNIPVHHNGFPHEALGDLLKNHKGGFVLSYNNCPTIREYYKEFQQFFPSWQYTMGQGETRIGLNRKNGNGNHVKESHEIIIFCPPKN